MLFLAGQSVPERSGPLSLNIGPHQTQLFGHISEFFQRSPFRRSFPGRLCRIKNVLRP